MATVLPALSLVVLHAATLSSSTLPGAGRAEAVLTLDAPGAIHLSAKSAQGTACELIDRVRGPFARAGAVGGQSCELDLLLDAGQYKVRVESPSRGKGQVTLTATPFQELNATPLRLEPGTSLLTKLKPQQQATFWLSMKQPGVPWVRLSGRHAGEVQLWRNGEWLEGLRAHHAQFSPKPGQPMHEWWLDERLEAGDYQLVVYGKSSATITGASVDDSLTIETGFRAGPAERAVEFTLPPSGLFAVQVPQDSLAAVMTAVEKPASPLQLQTLRGNVRSPSDACTVDAASLSPRCAALLDGRNEPTSVLLVRGAPGTRGQLEWAPLRSDGRYDYGGYYGPMATHLRFLANHGRYALGVNDLPDDTDAAPLGCLVERIDQKDEVAGLVGHAMPAFAPGERLEFNFNYSGSEVVWFEVKSGGLKGLFSSSKMRVQAKGERRSTCELYRITTNSMLERLSQSSGEGCDLTLPLSPGLYQLSLTGGNTGVEQLSISGEGDTGVKPLASTGGCTLPDLGLEEGRYRLNLNRRGAVTSRGLTLASLPWKAPEPLHLRLDAQQAVTLPIELPAGVVVRSTGGVAFGCAVEKGTVSARQGVCELRAGSDRLKLANTSDKPVTLTLSRPGAMPAFTSPVSFNPTLTPLPKMALDVPAWFDFEREQSWSATFEVAMPGLYNVTTQGLLATRCSLRTPVISDVAQASGGGRGRNCLIQTYLQKGRYLLTAQTTGLSRGRAALSLTRRPVREQPGITGEGEQFFRAEANELVQQKLVVKTAADFDLGTTSQGTSLSCRLDDPDGWPIEPVPSQCNGVRHLRPGTWLWTQLPLTVESMRRTRLHKVREAVTLSGNKPHKVDAFTWYTAELGSDGKDEFLFSLEGETQLDVVLTNGMQGRVFRLEKDKPPRAVEVVPPTETASDEGESESGSYEEEAEERSYDEGDGEEGDGAYEDGPPPPRVEHARAAPPPPSGAKLTLPPGQYKLMTEHSRGDVGVSYQLHFGSAVLLPGMRRTLPAPSVVPLFVPRDGTLRLRTEGEVDVRCRVLDAQRRLVLEGSENGTDWNCAIAEPIAKGQYTLVLESETQQTGETTLSVALPTVEEKGALTDGAKLTLGASVVAFTLPVAERDAVHELSAKAQGKTPLSCALEDESGKVVHRLSRVRDCTLLVRPQLQKFKLRLWTTDGSATVVTGLKTRLIAQGKPGTLSPDAALAVTVARAGRYRTAAEVACIGGNEAGLLQPCGPETSLEAGPVIFSAATTKSVALPLEETVGVADGKAFALPLNRRPFVQALKPGGSALVLLEARVQHGEKTGPACGFDGAGTVTEARADSCFAASRVGSEAVSRVWAASDAAIDATIVRRVVALPTSGLSLSPGRTQAAVAGVARLDVPKQRARVELTLGDDAWAVLVGDDGAAIDLCAPTGALRRCVLTARGGSVVLQTSENRVDVTTVLLEGAATDVRFTGLYEDAPRAPGTLRLEIAAGDKERFTSVEGALRCTLSLADGTRVTSCRAKVPAKQRAELIIEHDTGPLRALLHAPGKERQARLGLDPALVPGAALAASTAVPLQNGRLDRTVVVDKEAVVRVSAEAGVCGLFRGGELLNVDGLDGGCELVRVLSPGTYRVVVRPFAGRVAPGSLRWSADAVTQLTEGVGTEERLAPGDVRLYRFETGNKGKVGLGVQAKSELLECAVYDDTYQLLGEGCHQYLSLNKGRFLLTVRNPPRDGAAPIAIKPVLLGLSGENNDVPEEYLRGLLNRAGVSR